MADGEAMRFIAQALEKVQQVRGVGQEEGILASGNVDLFVKSPSPVAAVMLTLFGQGDYGEADRRFLVPQEVCDPVEMPLAAVQHEQIKVDGNSLIILEKSFQHLRHHGGIVGFGRAFETVGAVGFLVGLGVFKNDHGSYRVESLQVRNINTGHAMGGARQFQKALQTFQQAGVALRLPAVEVEAFPGIAGGKVEELASPPALCREDANAVGFGFSEPFFEGCAILQGGRNDDFIGDKAPFAVVLLNE